MFSQLRLTFLATLGLPWLTMGTIAAPIYWDGTGTSWNSPASWSDTIDGLGANVLPGSGDVATFSASTVTTVQTVNLNGNQSVGGIEVTGPAGTTVTLQGGGTNGILELGTSGITVGSGVDVLNVGSTATNQHVDVSLLGSQSWIFNGTNTANRGIFVKNAVSLGQAGNATLTLGGSAGTTANSAITGVISDGGTDRVLSLTMNASSGNNRWNLSGNNTYTGVTTITKGALGIGHANALGSTAAGTVVGSGASLFMRASINVAAEELSLTGTGVSGLGALRNVTGTSTWNGAITADTTSANVRIGADAGSLTLSTTADITATGNLALEFTSVSAAGTGNIIVNGNISGSISVAKILGTANTLTFGGDAKDYTGTTSVAAGALFLNTALTNTSGVSVAAGAALRGDNGSINTAATTTVNGILGPGATLSSIGTLNMGALSLTSTATFQLEINTGTPASDLVNVTGNLSLDSGNATVLSITDLGPVVLTNGVFKFIDYSGAWNGGLFTVGGMVIGDNANTFSLNGNEYQIDYDYGGPGGAVALLIVPEPSVGVGLAGGLGMMLAMGRFRKRARG